MFKQILCIKLDVEFIGILIKESKTKEYASVYGWPDAAVLSSIHPFYYYQMNG